MCGHHNQVAAKLPVVGTRSRPQPDLLDWLLWDSPSIPGALPLTGLFILP
jgi:hypothetical protein